MTPAETGKVLMKLAAYDQRTIGHGDIAAWHEVIGHLDLDSCLAAVTVHYRENAERAWPSEIRKLATDIRVRARTAEERRLKLAEASPNPARTGAEMVRYVLAALADAGQDPRNGAFLGRQVAADIADEACQKWLAATAPTRALSVVSPVNTVNEGEQR